MIEVIYNHKNLHLTMDGHAGSDEKGHDLVCAAATVLAYTLAANVTQLCADNKRYMCRPMVDLKDGHAEIGCNAMHGMQAVAELIFGSICVGFELLAQRYPQNIKFHEK